MPIASTRASSETMLSEKPMASITAKVPISDTGTAISGISVARSIAQEQEHHDHDQHERLDQGVDHLVDALEHERGRIVGGLVGDALGELRLQALHTAWTPSAVARALAPGAWKMAIRRPGRR